MSSYSNEEILQEARLLAAQLSELERVRAYRQAEEKIAGNQRVQELIANIKRLQKQTVNLAHYQKHEAYRESERKRQRLQAELDALPIVQQYQRLLAEVNDLLQQSVGLISKRINEAAEREADEHDSSEH